MKYLVRQTAAHVTFTYQRRWPAKLASVARAAGYGAKFTTPTGCPIDANEVTQAHAKQAGDTEYDRTIALLKLAESRGDTGIQIVGLNAKGKPTGRASRLGDGRKAKKVMQESVTVFELLGLWLTAHPDQSEKGLADRQRYWTEWTQAVGSDLAATDSALPEIHRGFDVWQAEMQRRGCTSATIERARNSVASVLRWGAIEYRVNWHISLKRLPKQAEEPKAVLTSTQQAELLRTVVESNGPTAAMVAVMLAGGVMPSEIARLDKDEAVRTLGESRPYLTIGSTSKVKAAARRRVVPIVWDADVVAVVREHLPTAIDRAREAKDSSATVNKWLKVKGFNITGHGLRHTLMAVAQAAMANPLVLARVGGWSAAGLNPVMMGYGADVSDSELLDTLTTETRRWWSKVISDAPALRVVASRPA